MAMTTDLSNHPDLLGNEESVLLLLLRSKLKGPFELLLIFFLKHKLIKFLIYNKNLNHDQKENKVEFSQPHVIFPV